MGRFHSQRRSFGVVAKAVDTVPVLSVPKPEAPRPRSSAPIDVYEWAVMMGNEDVAIRYRVAYTRSIGLYEHPDRVRMCVLRDIRKGYGKLPANDRDGLDKADAG